jgi:hypothetical protein
LTIRTNHRYKPFPSAQQATHNSAVFNGNASATLSRVIAKFATLAKSAAEVEMQVTDNP